MVDDAERAKIHEFNTIEGVRKRPAMYLGSTDFFGFIQYLVCPVALLLGHRASRIVITAEAGRFVIESDVAIPFEETTGGRIGPFEAITWLGGGHGFEAMVLNAASERLEVDVRGGGRLTEFVFCRGTREFHRETVSEGDVSSTTLRFSPDPSILTITHIAPAIFKSYLRRLSYLHRGVLFSLAVGGELHEFRSEQGLRDLFAAISAPYQLLHEPIHIEQEQGSLRLEAVLAYHGWKEDGLWCFINNGRAIEGGTHERGLREALNRLGRVLELTDRPKGDRNGVVGILSVHYPDAAWEGCVKSKVSNPELRPMVRELILQGATEWRRKHPDMAEQLRSIEPFRFPAAWDF